MPDLIYPRTKDGKTVELFCVIENKIVELPDGSLLKLDRLEHAFPIPENLIWRFLVFLISFMESEYHVKRRDSEYEQEATRRLEATKTIS